MGMLQHRLGSQREAIQQGGDYSPRKSVAEKMMESKRNQ